MDINYQTNETESMKAYVNMQNLYAELEEKKRTITTDLIVGSAMTVFGMGSLMLDGIASVGIAGVLIMLPKLLVIAYSLMCIPFGWSALNKLTPNTFLILPLVGWILYFAVKFTIGFTIGMFVAPVAVYNYFKLKKKVQSTSC